MSKKIWIAGSAAVVLAGLGLLLAVQSDQPANTPVALSDHVQSHGSDVKPRSFRSQSPGVVAKPVSPVFDHKSAVERQELWAQKLDQSFGAEPMGDGGTTEAKARATLSGDDFAGIDVRDVRCRETICRVDFLSESPDEQEVFLAAIAKAKPFRSHVMIFDMPEENGKVATRFYSAREGFTFTPEGRTVLDPERSTLTSETPPHKRSP